MLNKIKTTINIFKQKGILYTIKSIYFYFVLNQFKIRKKLSYKYIKGNGLEIGSGNCPLEICKKNTNVKYVDYIDEDKLKEYFSKVKKLELQKIDYICMADNLDKIDNNSQDFVIGNHLFEHLNNPIKTLIEWYRVLKNGGIIFMAIPDKRRTFDINRERTSLEHIVLDYKNPSDERDWEHYLEFAGISLQNKEGIEKEAKKLIETNYSIHYHVFEEDDILKIIEWCNKNTNSKFEIVHIKHTSKNLGDNEFIFILKAIK